MKAIKIPSGARVSLSAYASAWRAAKAGPGIVFNGWAEVGASGSDIYREMIRGLHDRINRRGGLKTPVDSERWHAWRRDQMAIEDYRLRRIVRRGSGLETEQARRVAPDVHAAFRDRLA